MQWSWGVSRYLQVWTPLLCPNPTLDLIGQSYACVENCLTPLLAQTDTSRERKTERRVHMQTESKSRENDKGRQANRQIKGREEGRHRQAKRQIAPEWLHDKYLNGKTGKLSEEWKEGTQIQKDGECWLRDKILKVQAKKRRHGRLKGKVESVKYSPPEREAFEGKQKKRGGKKKILEKGVLTARCRKKRINKGQLERNASRWEGNKRNKRRDKEREERIKKKLVEIRKGRATVEIRLKDVQE